MQNSFFAGLLAFGLAFLLTPLARTVALRLQLVDHPGSRSVHGAPVPFLGGIALYVAFAVAVWRFIGWTEDARGLLVGGAFILFVGLCDDFAKSRAYARPAWLFGREGRGLRPWIKVAGQVGAGVLLAVFGVSIAWIRLPLIGWVYFNGWAVAVTVVWVVCVANVINLADGLDGLAAGITGIAALTLLVAAVETGQAPAVIVLTAVLFGASAGFLPWNWSPARIFMGDAGALFLGFALAAISIEGTLKSPAVVALAVPVLALGLPVFDTLLAIRRRWRGGQPIGAPDREHLHHRLLHLGLSQRDAVVVLYCVSGWLSVSALAVDQLRPAVGAGVVVFVVLSLAVVARRLDTMQIGRRS